MTVWGQMGRASDGPITVCCGGRVQKVRQVILSIMTVVTMVALLSMGLAGCAGPQEDAVREAPAPEMAPEAMDEVESDVYPEEMEGDIADQMMVRSGWARYEVRDVDGVVQQITALVDDYGATMEESSIQEYEGRKTAAFSFRVPSEDFDGFMGDLGDLEGSVSIETTAEDVAEEAIDLEARLEVSRAQEQRLVEMLDQANTVEEMLMIEEELGRVRSEIESMQGRLDYLRDRASFARVHVTVSQKAEAVVGESATWGDFGRAVVDGWRIWSDRGALVFLALLRAWPLLLVMAAVIVLVVRWRKSRRLKIQKVEEE